MVHGNTCISVIYMYSVLSHCWLGLEKHWACNISIPRVAKVFLRKLLLLLHLFNVSSSTTWVSRHQKGKPFSICMKQEMMEWQWHQLDHMQIICTLLQTDNHASTSSLSFCRLDVLPATQPTASKCWRKPVGQIAYLMSGRNWYTNLITDD